MSVIGDYTERVQTLLSDYLQRVEAAERSQAPTDGLLGMKGGAKDDPCHDRFAADLDALLAEATEEPPGSEQIRDLFHLLFSAPKASSVPKSAYWMLLAVHSLLMPLTEQLTPEDAKSLSEEYCSIYPRRERLPAQQKLLNALRSRAGNQNESHFLSFFMK